MKGRGVNNKSFHHSLEFLPEKLRAMAYLARSILYSELRKDHIQGSFIRPQPTETTNIVLHNCAFFVRVIRQ